MKTTRITVETETMTIVRRARVVLAWCPDCRAEVEVIRLESDNPEEPTTAAQLQESLGTGKPHLWQPAIGPAQICVTSLLHCFETADGQAFCRANDNGLDQRRRNGK